MFVPMDEEGFAAIKKLWDKGLPIQSVTQQTGWSRPTVYRVLHSDDMDGYRALNRMRSKANYERAKGRSRTKRQREAPPNRVVDEDEIQRLYDSGYTTQQVRTELKLSKNAITKINSARRQEGKPPLCQKNVCRHKVDRNVFISSGILKMAYLLDMVNREHRSLVTVQADWCVEWDAGTAALQKNLALFRRRVDTSKKRSSK